MNHIARSFAAPDGRTYRSHVWELRGGAFRRIALCLGNPLWPFEKEKRLIQFLAERGFRVHELELGFAGSGASTSSLSSLRSALAAYAAAARGQSGLPLYLVAQSFSAALVPGLIGASGLEAALLVSPVVGYPPPGLRMGRCFLSRWASLGLGAADLSGRPELLAELLGSGPRTLRFRKSDLKALAPKALVAALPELGVPVAVFAGEEDELLGAEDRGELARSGAKVYAYPRVRHAIAYDRYADNFFADLGSFIDEVEAKRRTEP